MDHLELTRISVSGNGTTDPYVPSGIEIILIQNGNTQVGRLFYTSNTFDTYIEHPENNAELAEIAARIIIEKDPKLLESENSILLICPIEIKNKMIWKD